MGKKVQKTPPHELWPLELANRLFQQGNKSFCFDQYQQHPLRGSGRFVTIGQIIEKMAENDAILFTESSVEAVAAFFGLPVEGFKKLVKEKKIPLLRFGTEGITDLSLLELLEEISSGKITTPQYNKTPKKSIWGEICFWGIVLVVIAFETDVGKSNANLLFEFLKQCFWTMWKG